MPARRSSWEGVSPGGGVWGVRGGEPARCAAFCGPWAAVPWVIGHRFRVTSGGRDDVAGFAEAVAVAVKRDDVAVMKEAVEDRGGDRGVWEELRPVLGGRRRPQRVLGDRDAGAGHGMARAVVGSDQTPRVSWSR